MTAAAPVKSVPTQAVRPLPLVAYFEGDQEIKFILSSMQRYRRLPFEGLEQESQDVEQIIVASSQAQVERHYNALRKPNVRVIGLCENKFRDARMDGAVYAYLPPSTPLSLLQRMIDNAIDHIQLLANRNELND